MSGIPTNLTVTNSLSAHVSLAAHSEALLSMATNNITDKETCQKSRSLEHQKSPASSSIVSLSSDDVIDSGEDQKPIFRWMHETPNGIELTKEVPLNVIAPTLISAPVQSSHMANRSSPGQTLNEDIPEDNSETVDRKPNILGFDFRRSSQTTENDESVPWNLVSPNLRDASTNQVRHTQSKLRCGDEGLYRSHSEEDIDDAHQSSATTSQYGRRDTDELTQALLDQLVRERRLQRCDHCNIIFPELSMYIFHRGCHGHQHPFHCHFCSTVLKDKFEFAAHFMYCVHNKK